MGYTHYFTQQRHFTPPQWRAFCEFSRRAIAAADIPLEHADVNEDIVAFNGAGDDGHETFAIEPFGVGFQFCKTARKPYDDLVVAHLVYLGSVIPGVFEISSDGRRRDWTRGLELARRAQPGTPMEIPASIDD